MELGPINAADLIFRGHIELAYFHFGFGG
jgi:hypothetical protein